MPDTFDPEKFLDSIGVFAPPPKPSSPGRRSLDYPTKFVQGVAKVPGALVGLADIPTGGAVGKFIEDTTGYDFDAPNRFYNQYLTPEYKQAGQEVSKAFKEDGFISGLGSAVTHPSQIAGAVAESLPSMLAGGWAGKVVGGALKAPTWLASGIGEGLITAGSGAEDIRTQTPDRLLTLEQSMLQLGSGILTAGIGAASGKLADRFRLGDIDQFAMTGKLSPDTPADLLKGLSFKQKAAKILGGTAMEGGEELLQSAQEGVSQNIALGKPITEGLAEQAGLGMLSGMAMGGPMATVQTLADNKRAIIDAASEKAKSEGIKQAQEKDVTSPAIINDAELKSAFRTVSKFAHPDAGGSEILFNHLNDIYQTIISGKATNKEYDYFINTANQIVEEKKNSVVEEGFTAAQNIKTDIETAVVNGTQEADLIPTATPSLGAQKTAQEVQQKTDAIVDNTANTIDKIQFLRDTSIKNAESDLSSEMQGEHHAESILYRSAIKQLKEESGYNIVPVKMKGELSDNLRTIAGAFGKKVGFYYSDDEYSPNGFVHPRTKDTLFINARGTQPHLFVLGHETLHSLRQDSVDGYSRLVDSIRPYVNQEKYKLLATQYGKDFKLDNDEVKQEFVGNLLGEFFNKPEGLQAMAVNDPNLFRQIGNAIKIVLAKLKRTLTARPLSNDFINNIEAVDAILKQYLSAKIKTTSNTDNKIKFSINKISPLNSQPTPEYTHEGLNVSSTLSGSEKGIPVIQEYGYKGKQLGKKKDKAFIKKITPPKTIDLQAKKDLNALELEQYSGQDQGFTPGDTEKVTVAEQVDGFDSFEQLDKMYDEGFRKEPKIKVRDEAPVKEVEEQLIKSIDKKYGKQEESFEYPKVEQSAIEEVVGVKYPKMIEVATKEGMKPSEIANKEMELRRTNQRVIDYLKEQMDKNEEASNEDAEMIHQMAQSLSDEGYIVKPILQEVFGEGANIPNLKELPIDDMMHIYDKIMNEGAVEADKQFTPERPERFVGPAIGSKERTPKPKETNLLTLEQGIIASVHHKEKAYDYYKKTFKDQEELTNLAFRVMAYIDELRTRGGVVDVKAVDLLNQILARFSEFRAIKGKQSADDGKRLLVKVLQTLSIKQSKNEDKVIAQLIEKYLDKSSLDKDLALYVLGFQLSEDEIKRSEKYDASGTALKNRQTLLIDDQPNVISRSEEEFDDFGLIDLINKENTPSHETDQMGDRTEEKGTPNTLEPVIEGSQLGRRDSSKQNTYTVELLSERTGNWYKAEISQSRMNKITEEGTPYRRITNKPTPTFDALPEYTAGQKTMVYAGVGSREVPANILLKMTAVAKKLAEMGYTLNSGGAKGSDTAFEKGATKKQIFYAKDATNETIEIAKEIHPKPEALGELPLQLMARNTNQVFGANLDSPVDFVLAWTKDGIESGRNRTQQSGGTGQAIDMASRKGIPVININSDGWQQKLRDAIEGKLSPEKYTPQEPEFKSQNKRDVLFDIYYDKYYVPSIINLAKEKGYASDLTKLRSLWKELTAIKKRVDNTKGDVKELREQQREIQSDLTKELAPIKQYLIQDKINGMSVLSPVNLDKFATSFSEAGLDITPADIYHLYQETGFDVARTLSRLRGMLNTVQAIGDITGATATGVPIVPLEQQPIKPTRSESELAGRREAQQATRAEDRLKEAMKGKTQPLEIAPRSSSEALQALYRSKGIANYTSTEKAFIDKITNRYAVGDKPIVGKLNNSVVQSFFEKIAGLFGAELVIVRNADFDARYYPDVDGKPVLVINLDSNFSFTRLFAHELFHHVLNKISPEQYKVFKDALRSVVNKGEWDATVQRMMAKRADISSTDKYEIFNTDYYNSRDVGTRRERTSYGLTPNQYSETTLDNSDYDKVAAYLATAKSGFPLWMVNQLFDNPIYKQSPLPERVKLFKAKIKSLNPVEAKNNGMTFGELQSFKERSPKYFAKLDAEVDAIVKQKEHEATQYQNIKDEIEEELHSELFSYAFTQQGFWNALNNTFEGKSIAAKLTIRLMQNAIKVSDMMKAIASTTRSTKQSVDAQIAQDNALRSLVSEWFDHKDMLTDENGIVIRDDKGEPIYSYQGGLYELLATVLDQAYLSDTFRHAQIKSMTAVDVATSVKDEVVDYTMTAKDHLTNGFNKLKGMKSYKDLMTVIEELLTATVKWIGEHKPKGMFEDFLADPKQVAMANKIAYYGQTMASLAYERIVKKFPNAFKGMSDIELEELHDKLVRTNNGIDVTTEAGKTKAKALGITDDQIAVFAAYKTVSNEIYTKMEELYPGLAKRQNHYGQSIRWMRSDNTFIKDDFDWVVSDEKSQLEGAKQYLKGKAIDRTTRSIADSGLRYQTINPHELFLNYVNDAYRLISLKEQVDAGLANGIIKIFSNQAHANNQGYIPIDDNSLKIFQRMNLESGYKIRSIDGTYVQEDGKDAIYGTEKEANEALAAFNEEGAVIDKVVPDKTTKITHYSVYRIWEFKGKTYRKEVSQARTEKEANQWIEDNAINENQYEVEGQKGNEQANAVVAQMYIKPDLARMLKVLMSTDKFRNASAFGFSGNNVMDAKNMITSLELCVSMFHAFTIGQELSASTAAWSYARGKGVIKGFNLFKTKTDSRELAVLLKAAMADKDIVNNVEYKKKMKELLGTDDADVLDVIKQFFGHGGMLHQDVSLRSSAYKYGQMHYHDDDVIVFDATGLKVTNNKPVTYKHIAESFTDSWNMNVKNNPNSMIAAITKTAAFGLLQAPTAWLMEDMIPKFKMTVFAREYTLKLDQQKDALAQGLTTREEIARDTMKFVEDRFGEVNWQNMWMDKTVKTTLQFLFRSFTWFSGSFKALGKAGLDIAKLGWFRLKGEKYVLTEKGYWGVGALLSHVFTAMAIWTLFNGLAAITGADVEPDDEDLPLITKALFPRVSAEDPSKRVSIPSYITEAYKILMHLGFTGSEAEYAKLISGRFNGLIGKLYDELRGEDFRGVSIRNKADNIFKQSLDSILYFIPKPIFLSSFMQDYQTKGFEAQNIGVALMGLTTAPSSALRSEAANKAFAIGRKEYKGKEITEEDMAEKDTLKRAMFAWQKGDKSKVDELVAEGRVSQRQLEIAKARYPKLGGTENKKYTEPLGLQLKRLTIEGSIEVFDKMTDREKDLYKKDIRKKYYNMLARQDKPKTKKDEVKDMLRKRGLI